MTLDNWIVPILNDWFKASPQFEGGCVGKHYDKINTVTIHSWSWFKDVYLLLFYPAMTTTGFKEKVPSLAGVMSWDAHENSICARMSDMGCLVWEHDSGNSGHRKTISNTQLLLRITSYRKISQAAIPLTVPVTLLLSCSDHGQRPQLGPKDVGHQPTVACDKSAILPAPCSHNCQQLDRYLDGGTASLACPATQAAPGRKMHPPWCGHKLKTKILDPPKSQGFEACIQLQIISN